MNKKISSLIALACAASCALTFVACDEPASSGDPAKSMTSEKLTETKWEKAFDAENFTEGKIVSVETRSGTVTQNDKSYKGSTKSTATYIIDGNNIQCKTEYTASGDKGFVDYVTAGMPEDSEAYNKKVDDDIYLLYHKDEDENWVWEVNSYQSLFYGEMRMVLGLKDMYDSFEYNDSQKGYTEKENDSAESNYRGMVLKFKDDKLAAIYSENKGTDYTVTYSYTITYGNQTVNIPTTKASDYSGVWKTEELVFGGLQHFGIDDEVPAGYLDEDPVTVTEDFVKITASVDGTASFMYRGTTGVGAWIEQGSGIVLYSNDLPAEVGGSTLALIYDDTDDVLSFTANGLTVILKK